MISPSLPDIDLSKELKNPRDCILVFDDLERCKMPVSEVMGYINGFVEHDQIRTIILANEKEILSKDDRYKDIKKKLIGQTIAASTTISDAFDSFLDDINNHAVREFLRRHKDVVLSLHAQGGLGNLRSLKFAMWNFEKIGSKLAYIHWEKENSVLKIAKAVISLTLEVRNGNLDESSLNSLMGDPIARLRRRDKGEAATEIDLIVERYPQVDFDNVMLSAPLFDELLLRGEISGPDIVAALDASSDYAKPGEQPLWRQAMEFFRTDDATCDRIATELEAAFAKRAFTVRGELMQIFGVRLWFAKIGLIPKETIEVVAEFKAYVDDLARDDRLETSLDRPRERGTDNFFDGYRIVQSETSEWRDGMAHYDNVAKTVEQNRYPAIAQDLVDRLSTDPDGFLFDLAVNNARTGRYWDHPVLASFPPERYAEITFTASPEIQSRALEILHSRHERDVPSLRPERCWIAKVKAELEKLMVTAKPMTRYRLESRIARNIDPILGRPEFGGDSNS